MLSRHITAICICLFLSVNITHAQTSADYAVQLTATVQESPAQITISWPAESGTTSYTIYRKGINNTLWGPSLGILPGTDTSFTDTSVVVDSAYEYYVIKSASVPGRGYIYAGIKNPAIHNRGTLLLLVDSTFTDSCAAEINQLMQDISGDGWAIVRHDLSRNLNDTTIHNLIKADYSNYTDVEAVLILGHLAVPYSGDLNPDGHPNHLGAWPADVYYGDMSGTWTDVSVNDISSSYTANQNAIGDGKWDQTTLPANIKLEVSRIDFYDMPAFSKTEVQLMQSYLSRDHLFKMDSLDIKHRALIDDNFGVFSGEAFAANGWRNFSQLIGKNNTQKIDFITSLNDSSYLWAYGCGGGTFTSASGIGSTTDFTTNNVNGIFTMLFGSYFGDWNVTNNFLRAPLCSDTPALTSCWAGRPNWFFHHMALGENIGYSARLSQNNSGLYMPTNYGARFVHVALMGDLTLRMDYINPASGMSVVANMPGAGATISWTSSPDASVIGYYVYRCDSMFGNYQKISGFLTSNTYTDTVGTDGLKYFMVRPVKLQNTPSGNYYNLGIGIKDTATVYYPTSIPIVANAVNHLLIYPNPTNDDLNISMLSNNTIESQIFITDQIGRTLRNTKEQLVKGTNKFSFNVSSLPDGLYTISIRTGNETITRKWVKYNR